MCRRHNNIMIGCVGLSRLIVTLNVRYHFRIDRGSLTIDESALQGRSINFVRTKKTKLYLFFGLMDSFYTLKARKRCVQCW